MPGEGLTAEGVGQAGALADALAAEELSLGASSELARTSETLEIALDGRDVPRIVVPELNEIDFGSFDGGPLADYREWAASHSPGEPAPGDGESRGDAAGRFARGLRVLLERDERVVLVVGHALFVRYVLDAAEGFVPAPLTTPVEHATPYRLGVREVEAATELLRDWSKHPVFREPSSDGRA